MIENILILDTETTGLDPSRGSNIIEIGVILYNIKYKAILQQFSSLLPCSENPVEKINHINSLASQGKYPFVQRKEDFIESVWEEPESPCVIIYDDKIQLHQILINMAKCAEACVAHNAEFDRKFVNLIPGCTEYFSNMKWICTKKNFTWPVKLPGFKLEDICREMHVPYSYPHRALADCLLLSQCFDKIEDLQERFNRC